MTTAAGQASPLRIDVSSIGGTLDGQTRAYAEYRLFSRLAPGGAAVDYATIALIEPDAHAPLAVCTITISLHHGHRVRVIARAPHVYDAIDRAVDEAAKGVHS